MRNTVILTGAGISAEPGVPTFRAADGFWCGHRVEAVATPEGYEADPANRRSAMTCSPNASTAPPPRWSRPLSSGCYSSSTTLPQ